MWHHLWRSWYCRWQRRGTTKLHCKKENIINNINQYLLSIFSALSYFMLILSMKFSFQFRIFLILAIYHWKKYLTLTWTIKSFFFILYTLWQLLTLQKNTLNPLAGYLIFSAMTASFIAHLNHHRNHKITLFYILTLLAQFFSKEEVSYAKRLVRWQ